MNKELSITQEWDRISLESSQVNHRKVSFPNRFGITLVADLHELKEINEKKLPAIVMSGPFGVVKERSSGLYAQTMAERGFLAIAPDPSLIGESGGIPRYVASPDTNIEDFQATIDLLSVQENVNPGRIGIIGICGWGGMALNVVAIDTRAKAIVVPMMYDMIRITASGYFDIMDENARYEARKESNAQRIIDFKQGDYARARDVVDLLPEDVPRFVRDYHVYYKTDHGYHVRSSGSNDGWNRTSGLSLMNTKPLHYIPKIRHAVSVIRGGKAHPCYFGEDAFKEPKGNNKELMVIPGASHTDLYDRTDIVSFEKMTTFFKENLV